MDADRTQQVLSGLRPGDQVVTNALMFDREVQKSTGTVIQKSVTFALQNRFLVLCAGILLLVWGAISFKNLPVEAYPDVANNYVQVITQWPGRAAEEVEQQVTIPIEVQMNGLPQLVSLRSWSLAGLSSINLTFDDGSNNDLNRQKVLEKLSQVNLPNGLQPTLGADYSPVGQIYFFTLKSTNPNYDVHGAEGAPGLGDRQAVEVGARRGGRFHLRWSDPRVPGAGGPQQTDLLWPQSIGQVEAALSNNNVNAGGSFIERGEQAINVRAVGLVQTTDDIAAIVLKTQNGIPVRVRDIGNVRQGPKIRLGQLGKADHSDLAKVVDDPDVVSGIVLLRKGADGDNVLTALHEKVDFLNNHFLPPGVKIVPHLDRSDLVHLTTHTVLHNLTEGIILVSVILFIFLGNVRGALIVTLTIPFSLLFASLCLDLRHIPANLLSLGALDFGMIVEGAIVMVENIVRLLSHPGDSSGRDGRRRRSRGRRTRCNGRSSTRSPLSSPPTCRSLPCSAWKAACSVPWPGRWPSRWRGRCCSRCFSARCWPASCFPEARRNGATR